MPLYWYYSIESNDKIIAPMPLKRPDIELFIPESDVIATGSHAGVFSLAIERLRQELPGAKIRMIGHETSMELFGYIIYAWVE